MDWYRLGAGWRFDLFHNRVMIMPSAEAAILDFSYDLKSISSAVSRNYTQGTARLGLDARYQFNRYLSFELEGSGSLPIDHMLQIYGVAGTVHIALAPPARRLRPELFAGVGWQRIDYEDNQTLPNHIRADFEPYMTTGLTLRF